MRLPRIEKGPAEGLYFVPIVYLIIVLFLIIMGAALLMYVTHLQSVNNVAVAVEEVKGV